MERQAPALTAKLAVRAGRAVAVAVIITGAALSFGGGTSEVPPPAATAHRALPPSGMAATILLAAVRRSAPGYASPGGRAAGTVPASVFGRPSVLPVIAVRPGWVRVRLTRRPNGSTAWLPASDVDLRSTPYQIVINLDSTRLSLYFRGRLAFSAPAGVGVPDDPTPTGRFFVQFDEPPPQPDPGYGPFIIVTSAHSPTISDWEGSGDALMGIHGPLGDSRQIGVTGARISHGCVRLHVQALERLREVPPGTPVDIISTSAGSDGLKTAAPHQ